MSLSMNSYYEACLTHYFRSSTDVSWSSGWIKGFENPGSQ